MSGKSSLPRWVLFADILAGLFAAMSVWFLVETYPVLAIHSRGSLSAIDIMFYCSFIALTLTAIALSGDYVSVKRYSRLQDVSHVIKAAFVSFALLVCSAFVLEDFLLSESYEFSRPGILIMVSFFVTELLVIRLIAHDVQIRLFGSGAWRKKMVIIGSGPAGVDVYEHLKAKNWLGVKCVGFVDDHAKVSTEIGRASCRERV